MTFYSNNLYDELRVCRLLKSEKMENELKLLNDLEMLYIKHIKPKVEKVILKDNKIKVEKTGLENTCSYAGIGGKVFCDYLRERGFNLEESDDEYYYIISWIIFN